MIQGTYPRYFSQVREGAQIYATFTFSDGSGAFTKTTGHQDLSMTRNTTGVYDLAVAGGARELVFVSAIVIPATPGTRANVRETVPDLPAVPAGTCRFRIWTPAFDTAGTGGVAVLSDPQAGSVLQVILWVGK